MMGLRSTTDPGSADTSLVTPSDKDLSSGQRRVLNQVNTMKRSKSKYKNGTTSPTSPASQTLKTPDFEKFKYRGASAYIRSNSSGSAGLHNKKSRSLTTKSMKGRLVSSNMEQVNTSSWTKSSNGLKPSRSDPALISASRLGPAPSMKAKGQISSSQIQVTKESRTVMNGPTFTESQTRISQLPSTQSQTNGKLGTIRVSKVEQSSMGNSTGNMQDNMTIKEAVQCLFSAEETVQRCGANFIQHASYNDNSAKEEVFQFGGIPPLVNMLDSSNTNLIKAASSALRNLVFQHKENKLEVQRSGGIAKVLNQMKNTRSTETRKQLAGLLWNLSSAEELRTELVSTAVIALTQNVVVPFSMPNDDLDVDSEVFYLATGCLRNLSSGSTQDRQKMRRCEKLIQALVAYISSYEKEFKPDEKSTENCLCILHNLTYNLWKECPEASFSTEAQSEDRKSRTVGCFSPRSRKAKDEIFSNLPQAMAEDSDETSTEVNWLFNSNAIDAYVLVLKSSKNDAIKEAICGAMQNLTASKEKGSVAVSEHLFKQLADNLLLSSLFHSQATQKTYVSLLDNMSRKPSLQSQMAPKVLPELVKVLSNDTWRESTHPDIVAAVCNVLHRLLPVNQVISKKNMTGNVIKQLLEISEKDPEDSGSLAASKLLHNLWMDKSLKSTIKHLKFHKSKFVNSRTIAAAAKSTPSPQD